MSVLIFSSLVIIHIQHTCVQIRNKTVSFAIPITFILNIWQHHITNQITLSAVYNTLQFVYKQERYYNTIFVKEKPCKFIRK